MVKVREDLTGRQFGRLTVTCQAEDYVAPSGKHTSQWECECSCPEHNLVIITTGRLNNPNGTRSCGCLAKEVASKTHKKYNKYQLNLQDENGTYGIGYCSNTNNEFYFDMDDYDIIKNWCWSERVDYHGYHMVHAYIDHKIVKMHCLLGYKDHDHIDRNPLNNRRYNFRPATASENNMNQKMPSNNTSGVIGVNWNKFKSKWEAHISINKKPTYLGTYVNKEDAIKARLRAEKQYYKEFAPQQHLFEQYGISNQNNDKGEANG